MPFDSTIKQKQQKMTMMTCSLPLSIFIKKTKKIMKISYNSSSTSFFLNPKNDENNGCN